MSKASKRSWFAALKHTKLLCFECRELKQVTKYIGEGRISLECGHDRHTRGNRVDEVEHKLNGTKYWH
jgi:hypothetical protein